MAEPLRYDYRRATQSGEPDEQGARPCPLHLPRVAMPPLTRVEHRAPLTVVAAQAGVGLTGYLAIAVVAVAACAMVVCAVAAPLDDGPTLPIESVLAERQPEGAASLLVSDMAAAYPVTTPGLRAALLRREASLPPAHAKWMTQPIALIADDAASRLWLTQQGDALHALDASVLVVRVKSPERMRALRAYRADLAMAPAAAPELVRALQGVHAAVYPIVILIDGRLTQDVRLLAPVQAAASPGVRP